jgi:hypothetical protein
MLVAIGMITMVALLASAWRLLHEEPRLEIGERGIHDRSLGLGWIRWDEIEGAYQRRSIDQDSIVLRLRCSERLERRLLSQGGCSSGSAEHGSLHVRLDLAGTSLSPVEVLQEILAHGSGGPRPAAG